MKKMCHLVDLEALHSLKVKLWSVLWGISLEDPEFSHECIFPPEPSNVQGFQDWRFVCRAE